MALAAQLALAIVFEQGFGALFWLLAIPELIAAIFAWRAAAGDRRAKLLLAVVAVVLLFVAAAVAVLALGLSLGQSSVVELAIWALPAVGSVLILLGSIMSMREV